MRNFSKLIGFMASVLLHTGCQEQDMMQYTNDPAIYFANETSSSYNSYLTTQHDSINHSFFIYGSSVTRDTVHVLIRTMGMPVDYDRPVSLVQTNVGQSDAAVPGVHFVPFDNPEVKDSICIPAGTVYQFVPIIVLRDESLASSEVRLELALEANEHFRQGIDAYRNFLVTTTDEAVKPSNWDTRWRYYFGASWGTEKMRFIIQVTGYTDFENIPSDFSYLTWLGDTAKQALLEYNQAHPDDPLCETDGTPVSFDN